MGLGFGFVEVGEWWTGGGRGGGAARYRGSQEGRGAGVCALRSVRTVCCRWGLGGWLGSPERLTGWRGGDGAFHIHVPRSPSAGLAPLLLAPIPCPPGSVTPKPQPGNPKPRVFRIPELKWVGRGGAGGGWGNGSFRQLGGQCTARWWRGARVLACCCIALRRAHGSSKEGLGTLPGAPGARRPCVPAGAPMERQGATGEGDRARGMGRQPQRCAVRNHRAARDVGAGCACGRHGTARNPCNRRGGHRPPALSSRPSAFKPSPPPSGHSPWPPSGPPSTATASTTWGRMQCRWVGVGFQARVFRAPVCACLWVGMGWRLGALEPLHRRLLPW